jgi:hypothetical protein
MINNNSYYGKEFSDKVNNSFNVLINKIIDYNKTLSEEDKLKFNNSLDNNLKYFEDSQEVGKFTKMLFNKVKRYLPLIDKDGQLYHPDGTKIIYKENK